MDGQITAIYKEGIGIKVSNGENILTVIQQEGKGKKPVKITEDSKTPEKG